MDYRRIYKSMLSSLLLLGFTWAALHSPILAQDISPSLGEETIRPSSVDFYDGAPADSTSEIDTSLSPADGPAGQVPVFDEDEGMDMFFDPDVSELVYEPDESEGSFYSEAGERRMTRRRLMQSEEECGIRDLDILLNGSVAIDESNPLAITLPVFVRLDGISPASISPGDVELNSACSVGSEPGLRREGNVTSPQQVEGGFVFDCGLTVNNDNDCEWNVIEVVVATRLPGTKCVDELKTKARYCKGELSVEPHVTSIQGISSNLREVPSCSIRDFNIEVSSGFPDSQNSNIATFPVRVHYAGVQPAEALGAAKFGVECLAEVDDGIVQEGEVVRKSDGEGEVFFDCLVGGHNPGDCRLKVHVEAWMEISDKNGTHRECSRRAISDANYCEGRDEPVTQPPLVQECTIEDFHLEIFDRDSLPATPGKARIPFQTVLKGVEPSYAAEAAIFQYNCYRDTSEGRRIDGVIMTAPSNGSTFCEVDIGDADCREGGVITLSSQVSIPGNSSGHLGCQGEATAVAPQCLHNSVEQDCPLFDFELVTMAPKEAHGVGIFPVFTRTSGLDPESLNSKFWCTSESGSGKKGSVRNARFENGGFMFDCEIEIGNKHDCEGNAVMIQGRLWPKNETACSQESQTRTTYCVPREVQNPDRCQVKNLQIEAIGVDMSQNEHESHLETEVLITYDLDHAEGVPVLHLECALDGVEGRISDIRSVERGFLASCTINSVADWNCETSKLSLDAKVTVEGPSGLSLCHASLQKESKQCLGKESQKLPYLRNRSTLDKCRLEELDVRIVEVDSREDESWATALVQVSHSEADYYNELNLHFVYFCSVNGVDGATELAERTKTGFSFYCKVQLPDVYESLHSVIQASAYASMEPRPGEFCSGGEVVATVNHCKQPECAFFPLEMGYEGYIGLMTDAARAEFLLACSHPIRLCVDCIKVDYPAYVESVVPIDDSDTAFRVTINRAEQEEGRFVLGLRKARRSREECRIGLRDQEEMFSEYPQCPMGVVGSVKQIEDISWTWVRKSGVPVKSSGFKIRKNTCLEEGCGHGLKY